MRNNSLRTAQAGNWEEMSSGSFRVKATPKFRNWLQDHGVKNFDSSPTMTESIPCTVTWKIRGRQAALTGPIESSRKPPENPSIGDTWIDPSRKQSGASAEVIQVFVKHDDFDTGRWIECARAPFYAEFKLDYDVCISDGKRSSPSNYRGSAARISHEAVARILHPASSRLEVLSRMASNSVPAFHYDVDSLADEGAAEKEGDDSLSPRIGCADSRQDIRWMESAPVGNGQFSTKFFDGSHDGRYSALFADGELKAFLKDKSGIPCMVAWDMRMEEDGKGFKTYLVRYSIESNQEIPGAPRVYFDGGDGMIVDGEMARKILVGHSRRILEPLLSKHHMMPYLILGDPESESWKERLSAADVDWVSRDNDLIKWKLVKKSPLD